MNSFVDSFVAPLSIINLLIIKLGLKKKDALQENFRELERMWDVNDIYAGDMPLPDDSEQQDA
jgi:DNA-binding MurR/RpiR family transcriptional regulator